MAQTAIDFYFIGLLVKRGGIREGLRDATLQLSLLLIFCVCMCPRAPVCVAGWVGSCYQTVFVFG